jgi:hypothetical protein
MVEFEQQKKVLFNILNNFRKCIDYKEYFDAQLMYIDGFLKEQFDSNTNQSKKVIRDFYKNNLSKTAIYGIMSCTDYIKLIRAKLGMAGIHTEWTIAMINEYVDNRLVFKLVSITNTSGGQITESSIPIKCHKDADKEKYMDRIVLNIPRLSSGAKQEEMYLSTIMGLDKSSINRLLKFTPVNYQYYALNDSTMLQVYPAKLSTLTMTVQLNTKVFYQSILVSNYNSNKNKEITQSERKELNKLNKTVQYNLKYICKAFICQIKLLNNPAIKQAYRENSIEDTERVFSDIIYLALLNQFNTDQTYESKYIHYKLLENTIGAYERASRLINHLGTLTNKTFNMMYDAFRAIKMAANREMEFPEEAEQLIKELSTQPILSYVDDYFDEMELTDTISSLVDTLHTKATDSEIEKYIMENYEEN